VESGLKVGTVVQPRYVLPLIVLFAAVALLHRGDASLGLSRLQLLILAGALSIANAMALHANIRRYVTGTDVSGWNLNSNIEWWWHLPLSPMFVWIAGSVTFALMLLALVPDVFARLVAQPHPDEHGAPASSMEPAGTQLLLRQADR
jgi:hypothetical protein